MRVPIQMFANVCLSNTAAFVVCLLRRVKDHHILLHYSPHLKKLCLRQVVLDKSLP